MAVLSYQNYLFSCTFNTGPFASQIMYLSSFNVNTLWSKTVKLKEVITVIMKDNTEFILRAEKFGFRFR